MLFLIHSYNRVVHTMWESCRNITTYCRVHAHIAAGAVRELRDRCAIPALRGREIGETWHGITIWPVFSR